MFRHPKYYKELRKRALDERNRERVIICSAAPNTDQEATSHKLPGPRPISNANKGLIHRRQAASAKLTDPQATSDKHQAPRHMRQA